MLLDITSRFLIFRRALNALWLDYYVDGTDDFDSELLCRLYEIAPSIFVDVVVYNFPSLNYRDFVDLSKSGSKAFYRSIEVELVMVSAANSKKSWLYDFSGNLVAPTSEFFERNDLIFGGFRNFDSIGATDYIEVNQKNTREPIGFLHNTNIEKFILCV